MSVNVGSVFTFVGLRRNEVIDFTTSKTLELIIDCGVLDEVSLSDQ